MVINLAGFDQQLLRNLKACTVQEREREDYEEKGTVNMRTAGTMYSPSIPATGTTVLGLLHGI